MSGTACAHRGAPAHRKEIHLFRHPNQSQRNAWHRLEVSVPAARADTTTRAGGRGTRAAQI